MSFYRVGRPVGGNRALWQRKNSTASAWSATADPTVEDGLRAVDEAGLKEWPEEDDPVIAARARVEGAEIH